MGADRQCPQRTVHTTLAARLIRYSTVRDRQCLQIDKVAVDHHALADPKGRYRRPVDRGSIARLPACRALDPKSEAIEVPARRYDSAELREQLDERGTKPVIPNRCNRKQPFSFNKRL
jgi:hypothetical protein